MIHTVIVEDDPMVAQINRQYLQQLGDFQIDGIFANGEEALEHLRTKPVDLAILDVYMPGMGGLELLHRMRAEHIFTPVIMVTAAAEMRTVEEALRLGIVDYLIKPFSFQRFQEGIQRYMVNANLIRSSTTVNQDVVDQLMGKKRTAARELRDLHKGLNQKTLDHIHQYLRERPGEAQTCEGLSAATGLSKVTIRRYLNYLIETGWVESSIDYETGGRPRVLYRLK